MITKIGQVTVLVRDQTEALRWYVDTLGLEQRSDETLADGFRWLTVAPHGQADLELVLVQADTAEKARKVGRQAADHVLFVFHTDDCRRDYESLKARGIHFFGQPEEQPWGIEVVFEDLYGNVCDLLEAPR
jgi:catechol 2,3-dioxygenase-like lactoylglutathione lyase family enzyme